jgi:hypothetical protein
MRSCACPSPEGGAPSSRHLPSTFPANPGTSNGPLRCNFFLCCCYFSDLPDLPDLLQRLRQDTYRLVVDPSSTRPSAGNKKRSREVRESGKLHCRCNKYKNEVRDRSGTLGRVLTNGRRSSLFDVRKLYECGRPGGREQGRRRARSRNRPPRTTGLAGPVAEASVAARHSTLLNRELSCAC